MLTVDQAGRVVLGRRLFTGLNWTIHPGERIGLVGPNGCGKTTLLKIIAGLDEPDEGQVHRQAGTRVAYLPQDVEAELSGEATILEAALGAADDVRQLGREVDELAEKMSRAAADPELLEKLSQRFGEKRMLYEWAGGDHLETRAKVVLGGLGFSLADFDRPVRTFSGGWRMRALMARLLLSGADLLLLDEPTNHLDLDALSWLENHLTDSPAAVVVVSHDRVFLDKVAQKVADMVGGGLRITKGGYTAWAAFRSEERRQNLRRAERLAREEQRLERFVERFGAKATKAAQARDRARMLEEVQDEKNHLTLDPHWGWRFRWPDPAHCPDLLVKLEGARKVFGDKVVFRGVNLEIRRGARLALMGPNGAGKTTLLRMITGELFLDGGRRESAPGLLIGSFAQHQLEALDPECSVLAEAQKAAPSKKPEEVRRALGTLGLGEQHIDRGVRTLSGGERARLALAKLMLRPASLLLLDEPTNHLDLPFREALEEALAAWPGTLVTVSHDRAFLDRLVTEVIAVQDQAVERFFGGWPEWMVWREEKAQQTRHDGDLPAELFHERSRAGRRARAEALQERSRRLKPLREEVARLEAAIQAAEQRLGEIDGCLGDPSIHADGVRMRALAREREALDAEITRLYPAWESAAAALDEAESAME